MPELKKKKKKDYRRKNVAIFYNLFSFVFVFYICIKKWLNWFLKKANNKIINNIK
jgi:hypothetical protein